MVLFMKVVRGEVMVPIEHILQINQSQTRAGTKGSYKQIRTNTETYTQSFFSRALKDWNNLPCGCTLAISVPALKQGLRKLN